eukprot:COSAG05_NODE_1878_length_3911_cov_62.469576_8_plen_124_part_01
MIAAPTHCAYTAGVVEVVERCVATATWCAEVDIAAANAQVLCNAAGGADAACAFTPADGAAGTPASCVAVQEAACNNAVLGAATCAAAGGAGTKSCSYRFYYSTNLHCLCGDKKPCQHSLFGAT